MIIPALLCAIGIPAGFLLIRRVPTCPVAGPCTATSFSIIIPARNEEQNLPRILQSISRSAIPPKEVIVVDDASCDKSAEVAATLGARVLTLTEKPAGWTGKSWACYQGAQNATAELLLFLDADTYFLPGGLDCVISRWKLERDHRLALSILPYHTMSTVHEQFSLFFNVLMAAGAGGFGAMAPARLFGQSLIISKAEYFAAGGHAAVSGVVLENLRLAAVLRKRGARMRCLAGRGVLHMRMFPDGFGQMSESWGKAFIQGAGDSGSVILACAIVWISCLWSTALLIVMPRDYGRLGLALAYFSFVVQIAWFARQLGNYRVLSCVFFPLPLAYYCAIFGQAAVRRVLRRKTIWKGREV